MANTEAIKAASTPEVRAKAVKTYKERKAAGYYDKGKAKKKSMAAAHSPAARKKAQETRARNIAAKRQVRVLNADQIEAHLESLKEPTEKRTYNKKVVSPVTPMDILGDLVVSVAQALFNKRRVQ